MNGEGLGGGDCGGGVEGGVKWRYVLGGVGSWRWW